MTNANTNAINMMHYIPVRNDWLDLHHEDILEPDLPIVDPHHHLWDRPGNRYLLDEILKDTTQAPGDG